MPPAPPIPLDELVELTELDELLLETSPLELELELELDEPLEVEVVLGVSEHPATWTPMTTIGANARK